MKLKFGRRALLLARTIIHYTSLWAFTLTIQIYTCIWICTSLTGLRVCTFTFPTAWHKTAVAHSIDSILCWANAHSILNNSIRVKALCTPVWYWRWFCCFTGFASRDKTKNAISYFIWWHQMIFTNTPIAHHFCIYIGAFVADRMDIMPAGFKFNHFTLSIDNLSGAFSGASTIIDHLLSFWTKAFPIHEYGVIVFAFKAHVIIILWNNCTTRDSTFTAYTRFCHSLSSLNTYTFIIS